MDAFRLQQQACKAENIYCLVHCKKHVLTPGGSVCGSLEGRGSILDLEPE